MGDGRESLVISLQGHQTPLYWAARTGCVPVTKALIEAGADLEIAEMVK